MCGIAGIIDYSNTSSAAMLRMMTDQLKHRGPDDSGYFEFVNNGTYLGLGHRRLSILDLSAKGHQPMTFDNCVIVFNGEIYNYQEIRQDLEGVGHNFDSNSDTEVALKAIYTWGPSAFKRFNGMFSIAFYDPRLEHLILVRDRAGVKPLYLFQNEDLLIFSSEISSFSHHPRFEKKIDKNSLRQYFKYGYIAGDASIFQNTIKLDPGFYLTISLKSKSISKECYWDIAKGYQDKKIDISIQDAVTETEHLLQKACNYRMVADVPVGVFLSGGYDSTAVTALIQKEQTSPLQTFTIGFEDPQYDEAPYAASIAKFLGTNHTELVCTPKDALATLVRMGNIWDEPFGDPSAIPTLLVSELARKSVKVSLSADGGDELFGGYRKYFQVLKLLKLSQSINKFPGGMSIIHTLSSAAKLSPENFCPNLRRKVELALGLIELNSAVPMLDRIQHIFSDGQLDDLLLDSFAIPSDDPFSNMLPSLAGLSGIDALLVADYQTYQRNDILTKVDRATMSIGLEAREPLLDFNLYEFVASLPDSVKFINQEPKYLLKAIVHKYVPRSLMNRPKQGFSIPLSAWLRTVFRPHLIHYLSKQSVSSHAILSPIKVEILLKQFLGGDNTLSRKIWLLLMFQLWCEHWEI
jgi:asparagine synthase (glutamine-hydrolysing)